MPASERQRELKRRRHRRQKVTFLRKRAEKASASEKEVIVKKLRDLTPGAQVIIESLGLAKK